MLTIGAQIVVLDPVGNWWGLRVDANGKSKGKDIFIAGGERGDVPILPESGARFGRLVVEKNVSMVLDISGFRQGERKRFAADFAEEFYHLKKTQRSAVHLFVEEAQLFVPQRSGPDEARMLGAYENIIRLGRNYGIGATLISQRPQSVNKEVLSQVECLCVLQVNGSHERKALEEWVQEAGADRKLIGELPGLGRGEGYVWSPSWLHIFKRVKFAKKTTFDASATPEVGKAAKAALLSAVDVEALKADLQEVIAGAEKDDPKALRRRIADLERAAATTTKADPAEVSRLRAELTQAHKANKEAHEHIARVENTNCILREYVDAILAIQVPVKELKPVKPFRVPEAQAAPAAVTVRLKPESEWPKPQRSKPPAQPRSSPESQTIEGPIKLSGTPLRIAQVAAAYEEYGGIRRDLLAALLGKTDGGTFSARLSEAKTAGAITVESGVVRATDTATRQFTGEFSLPTSTAEVLSMWEHRLRPGSIQRRIIDYLISEGGREVARGELAQALGTVDGGTFSARLSEVRSTGLLIDTRRGFVAADSEKLMLHGRTR